MATPSIPPFEATPIPSITSTASQCRSTFMSQRTKPLSYRLAQLRKLYWGVVDHTSDLIEAYRLDLGKPAFEAYMTEIEWVKNDIIYMTKNLSKWMKDENAEDMALLNKLLKPTIRKDPLGTVLIIGPFNLPLQLAFGPLIGAISAGCTAVLKPSEISPNTDMVMKKIIEESLDKDAYAVVNGAIPETDALLNEKWDKIFFIGSTQVGKIIAKKAAETLTPVCLEMGGRNPAIVTRNADVRLAARRLLWGKNMNAGQICVSQNYIMVDREVLPLFIEGLKENLKIFHPEGGKASPNFSRIVNHRHFLRIKKMLDETKGKILMGGEIDESENFIELTVVQVDDVRDVLVQEESFGPLITILPVDGVDDAIRIANEVDRTPLALYPFGTKAEVNQILNQVTSGGASINDSYYHASISNLAFGGVGDSGQGSYHGRQSFETFTHRRSTTTTPGWMDKLLDIRYPPYAGKIKKYKAFAEQKPNFDRQGRELRGLGWWVSLVLGLGGEGVRGVLVRWVVAVVMAVGVKRVLDGKGGWFALGEMSG